MGRSWLWLLIAVIVVVVIVALVIRARSRSKAGDDQGEVAEDGAGQDVAGERAAPDPSPAKESGPRHALREDPADASHDTDSHDTASEATSPEAAVAAAPAAVSGPGQGLPAQEPPGQELPAPPQELPAQESPAQEPSGTGGAGDERRLPGATGGDALFADLSRSTSTGAGSGAPATTDTGAAATPSTAQWQTGYDPRQDPHKHGSTAGGFVSDGAGASPTGSGTGRSGGSALAALDSGMAGPAGSPPSTAPPSTTPTAQAAGGPHAGAIHAPPDGSAPPETHQVKAHSGSRRYHTTDSPYYIRTRADIYFVGVAEAEAAGFVAWNERPGAR